MNIAEILKNCPKGTKLYSPIWGNVEFIRVNSLNNIEIRDNNQIRQILYPNGKYSEHGEVILFPSKKQHDWSKFLVPFSDGDIIIRTTLANSHCTHFNTAIFNEYTRDITSNSEIVTYCQVNGYGDFRPFSDKVDCKNWRLANAEEIQHFVTKMHESGYDFKDGKLIAFPNFKVGDIITNGTCSFKISHIDDKYYYEKIGAAVSRLLIQEQNKWKIKKFDIRSLKPYDKVLVRTEEGDWYPSIVSYVSVGQVYLIDSESSADYVIPFEGNERLIGGCNDPDPYYITWE